MTSGERPTTTETPEEREAYRASAALEPVRRFVNTYEPETGIEMLDSPAALAAWLADEGLSADPGELTDRDLQRVVEVREALREALLANNRAAPASRAYERLNRALAGATLEVRFDAEGRASLMPNGAGVDEALARIASAIREATATGEWSRLKVCPGDSCLWAFYDRSRNRSRTWCRMEVCGNRAKVRSYRRRHSG
ncbi:MAG TPA: CGNR zinc finger domain-containing protein [Solirubrobacterales bacterium]|nr:CGNR zinc finger domain-containing protein [Solirubrobacterales bacterium]